MVQGLEKYTNNTKADKKASRDKIDTDIDQYHSFIDYAEHEGKDWTVKQIVNRAMAYDKVAKKEDRAEVKDNELLHIIANSKQIAHKRNEVVKIAGVNPSSFQKAFSLVSPSSLPGGKNYRIKTAQKGVDKSSEYGQNVERTVNRLEILALKKHGDHMYKCIDACVRFAGKPVSDRADKWIRDKVGLTKALELQEQLKKQSEEKLAERAGYSSKKKNKAASAEKSYVDRLAKNTDELKKKIQQHFGV